MEGLWWEPGVDVPVVVGEEESGVGGGGESSGTWWREMREG